MSKNSEFKQAVATFLDPATSKERCREIWEHGSVLALAQIPFVVAVTRASKWDPPTAERCVRRAVECGVDINQRFGRGGPDRKSVV